MALVDINTILNSNPTKKLRIAFDNLKQNYTIENAEAYKKMYEDAPLSFIIENSRYIFSEPMLGYSFYKEQVVENPYALLFENYEDEILKISAYITECGDGIPSKQKDMYNLLCSEMEEKCNDTYSTRMILRHANVDEYVKESYDVLTDKSISKDAKEKVLKIVERHPEIKKTQHFNSTPVGYRYQITLTIYVDCNLSTFKSHEIANNLEKEIVNSIDEIYLAIIHVNPI